VENVDLLIIRANIALSISLYVKKKIWKMYDEFMSTLTNKSVGLLILSSLPFVYCVKMHPHKNLMKS